MRITPKEGQPEPPSERLESWKEIAAYLKRGVRSVQRWEKTEDLPIHRHVHEKLGTVYAYRSELDAWWTGRQARLEAEEAQESPRGYRHLLWLWSVALLGAVLLVGFTVWRLSMTRKVPAQSPRNVPVTSFPGWESQPAFSPDGSRIAFVWDDEKGNNANIYIKLIDAGTPLPLTTSPTRDSSPTWSPDGRYIAFLRLAARDRSGWYSSPAVGVSQLYLVPSLGGPGVKLAEAYANGNCQSLDWSPDGKLLVVTDKSLPQSPFSTGSPRDPFSIFLILRDTGEKQKLTWPLEGSIGDGCPKFAPDGKTLAFVRSGSLHVDDIYLVPVTGGELQRLTSDSGRIGGLAWTSDGREIVYSSSRGGGSLGLWRVRASGGNPEPVAAAGQDIYNPTISRQGNRLAYEQASADSNIWRMEISTSTAQGRSPAKLIYSTQNDHSPQYSPDGKRIAFTSNQSGYDEIWVSESDGSKPVRLTSFGGPNTGTPRWSPDGSSIAFGSVAPGSTDIYTISSEGGLPRRLTIDPSDDVRPSWSRDGRWIYFGSNRSGDWQIWKVPAGGGQAMPVTKHGGREALGSPDGKFVFYAKSSGGSWSIWRVPVEGGEEIRILDQIQSQGKWAVWAQGIYFVGPRTRPGDVIQFISLATGQVTQIAVLEKLLFDGPPALAVSPDGRWILYAQIDQSNSDIMLVDNFR